MPGRLAGICMILFLLFLPGCGKEIGDSCNSVNDCPSNAVCDTSMPGGYCTVTPCHYGECPSESRCIDYGHDNTFCMRRCNDDYDCREDYKCVETPSRIKICTYNPKSSGPSTQ